MRQVHQRLLCRHILEQIRQVKLDLMFGHGGDKMAEQRLQSVLLQHDHARAAGAVGAADEASYGGLLRGPVGSRALQEEALGCTLGHVQDHHHGSEVLQDIRQLRLQRSDVGRALLLCLSHLVLDLRQLVIYSSDARLSLQHMPAGVGGHRVEGCDVLAGGLDELRLCALVV
mmetsp:Transcript_65519/g.213338  ORF Transcript_65519/g.213338 Transcript_65519/m.213338 type:complete len:172 (+) Transcript_65519:1949-2464(+)